MILFTQPSHKNQFLALTVTVLKVGESIISLSPTELGAKSTSVSELSNTFAEVIALLLIVILFHVPPISHESCTRPAVLVVAYGIVAEAQIDIHADPSQK